MHYCQNISESRKLSNSEATSKTLGKTLLMNFSVISGRKNDSVLEPTIILALELS